MDIYIGDGDVVKMECKKTGERRNPNMNEWVLKNEAENRIEELEDMLRFLVDSCSINDSALEKEVMQLLNT